MQEQAIEIITEIMENLNHLFTVLHAEGASDYIPPGIYMGAMDALHDGTGQVDALFFGEWAEA
tara:strand:+ start:827 stop:1015 length:189 start_codon:yes stop_codon:yes gene_type:complete